MKTLLALGLALVDYLKLELQASRRWVLSLGLALGVLWGAVVLVVAAAGLLLFAVFLMFMALGLPASASAFLTAGLSLLFAAGLIWMGLRVL